jgi:hypothetical protein
VLVLALPDFPLLKFCSTNLYVVRVRVISSAIDPAIALPPPTTAHSRKKELASGTTMADRGAKMKRDVDSVRCLR